KQNIKKIEEFIREYDKKVADTMGEDYNNKFANMNFSLQDAFQKMLDNLEKVTLKVCEEKAVKNADLVAKVQVCVMLLEFTIVNLRERVRQSAGVNPVLSRIRWTAHDEMYHWVRNIDRVLRSPDISKDLTVRSAYFRLQKAWNNEEFLGDNLGEGLLEETEYEAIELSDLMKSQKKVV
ncbi:MAG: hypothetical protein Q4Q25_04315, partial [Methanocorpusculum sp.]|nr:hypothetical protein [Methanocorpusculum sp.]